MNENVNALEFEGYPTCNDVEDVGLRLRNRGHIIVNIVEDMTIEKKTKQQIWERVASYLRAIPEKEIPLTIEAFQVAFAVRSTLSLN